MLENALLYFIPSKGEFLKTQPGTGDNLLPEDIEEGYTDYILWSRFKPMDLGIDGELDMECLDSGMVMLDPSTSSLRDSAQDDALTARNDMLKDVLEQAYGDGDIEVNLLLKE